MRARARDRARVRSHGVAWGRVGCRVGAVSRGRSQRGLGGPVRGLSTASGPILRDRADRASQELSGVLSSERGRAVAITHKKSPHPVRGQGVGGGAVGAGLVRPGQQGRAIGQMLRHAMGGQTESVGLGAASAGVLQAQQDGHGVGIGPTVVAASVTVDRGHGD